MFSKIELSPDNAKQYVVANSMPTLINNLSRINIFIGTNNSGKSRLLRELFARSDYKFSPNSLDFSEFLSSVKKAVQELKMLPKYSQETYVKLISILENSPSTLLYDFQLKHNISTHEIIELFNKEYSTAVQWYKARGYAISPQFNDILTIREKYFDAYDNVISEFNSREIDIKRYYIPTLRSLKDISPIGGADSKKYRDIYGEVTKSHYFTSVSTKIYEGIDAAKIFTGLTLYDDINSLVRSEINNRKKKKQFENFLSESFFNNQNVEITSHEKGKILIAIDEEEYPIEQLGDGIQAIIILIYKLFMHQGENAVFFFEEPETHLHPGFQRLFIETLRRPEFNSFQYFMSTHSNHFLDITLENDDISVYTFNKKKDGDSYKFYVENVAHGDDNVLQLIGANKSSVFLSNCTIWVEGITDRIYLRKYIDLYQNHEKSNNPNIRLFKEDYHYSFVEYGGNNITHWSFLDSDDDEHFNINVDRLCAKAFLITDSDNTKSGKKKERQEKLKERLGNRYYCLQSKEIENIISKQVIAQVVHSYEKPDTVVNFSKFERKDISNQSLGKAIESTVDGLINKTKYATESGTINDKLGFAKKAVCFMHSYQDMSKEAQELAQKLYNFIAKQNS